MANTTSYSNERLNIWRALSELFLDTETDELTYHYIARTVLESKMSLADVEDILWYEVYPVLESNLRSVAGVWSGWPDEWLLQNLPAPIRPGSIKGKRWVIKEIKRCWQHVTEAYESQDAEHGC